MTSIRRRTMTLILGLLLVGLMFLSVVNVHDSRHEITEVYDAQLAQNARLLQGIIRMPIASNEHEQLYQAFNTALSQAYPNDATLYESKIAFHVWDDRGVSLFRTASAPPLEKTKAIAGFDDFVDQKKHKWRTFVLDDMQYGVHIWIGESNKVRADLVTRIVRHTLWPNLLGSLILIAVIWLAIGWGLKPLADLARTLRARHSGSLQPLETSQLPSELEPIHAALNRMLAQIQEIMARERRFIGDAAHEMRTPLAVLRVHAQNLLEAGSDEERRKSLEYLIVGVDRASRLVNQLLTMARLEPQPHTPPASIIDLTATVRDSLVQLTPWLLSKHLELSFDVSESPYLIKADPAAITIALNNLVTNAANFSPKHGVITVRLRKVEQTFELSVEDQGPGIDETERERLFERFYSRGNDHGAGLGLTIVQAIATRIGGQVILTNLPTRGLCASMAFSEKLAQGN